MTKRPARLTARIREKSGMSSRETVKVQRWDSLRLFQGRVIVHRTEEALEVAQGWTDQERTVCTDGLRLERGEVGAAVVWWREGGWGGQGTYLGKNKEDFDAEVFAILQAVKTLDARGEEKQSYTVFSDSQAAIYQVRHDDCGPAQTLARAVVDFPNELQQRGNSITIRWALSHEGVDGIERADTMAKRVAEGGGNRAPPEHLKKVSLSHLTRKSMETRSWAAGDWIRDYIKKEWRYCPPPRGNSARGWARFERNRREGFTTCYRATQRQGPTSGGSARHRTIGLGGAGLARPRRATIFSSNVGGGCRRFDDYGREGL